MANRERPRAAAGPPAGPVSLTLFSFLWAAAVLFDQAKWDKWAASPSDVLLSLSACWLLFRPWSTPALGIVLIAVLGATAARLPWVSNHWLLAALAALTMLLGFVRAFTRAWPAPIGRDRLFRDFAPALRLELVLFYVWAAFHKLNADYLDPAVSCAALFYGDLAGKLGFLPATDWTLTAAAFGSLAIELAIPLFLVWPRARPTGLVLAVVFHFLLGIGGFFNFSAYIYSMLFLFLPEETPARLSASWKASRLRRWLFALAEPPTLVQAYRWTTRGLFVVAAGILLSQANWAGRLPAFHLILSEGRRSVISYGFEVLWWVYAALVVSVWWIGYRHSRAKPTGPPALFRLSHPLYAVPILLVFLNGASPYLGFKTETSFAMFSNLRTEGERTNHLLVKRRARWTDFQEDLVVIESSSDPELQRVADSGFALTWFEFRSYLSRRAPATEDPIVVRYRRAGERRYVADAAADPGLSKSDGWWARKLLYFRPVSLGEATRCHH